MADPSLLISEKGTSCWPKQFADWLLSRQRPFPSQHLEADLHEWLNGLAPSWVQENSVGFKDLSSWQPSWLILNFRLNFDSHSSGLQTKPFMEAWDSKVWAETQRLAVKGIGDPIVCSEYFQRAEAELRVVGSALSSWL